MLHCNKFEVILIIVLLNQTLASSSDGGVQQDDCSQPVINNIYYGSESNNLLNPSSTGLPGKRGANGEKGQKGENGASFTGLEPILKDKIINTTEKVFDLDEKLNFLKENINQCTTNPSAPKVPVFKTCESLLDELPYAVSGMYVIHPNDQIEPFRVYCEVTESGIFTVFPPKNDDETAVTKCGSAKCFKVKIHYKHTMEQIRAVTDLSKNCRQHIKYRCRGSVLHWEGKAFASWFTYDDKEMSNWGGSDKNNVCACGESNSCLDSSKHCNCDKNDESVWTADEGYLTNKDQLPVSMLKFGDTDGSHEAGFYKLGPVQCNGL